MSRPVFHIDPVFHMDTGRCTGCQTCRIACRDRADLPDSLDWLWIDECEAGEYPRPSLTYRVRHCFHCAEPACIPACPEGAMARRHQVRRLR